MHDSPPSCCSLMLTFSCSSRKLFLIYTGIGRLTFPRSKHWVVLVVTITLGRGWILYCLKPSLAKNFSGGSTVPPKVLRTKREELVEEKGTELQRSHLEAMRTTGKSWQSLLGSALSMAC